MTKTARFISEVSNMRLPHSMPTGIVVTVHPDHAGKLPDHIPGDASDFIWKAASIGITEHQLLPQMTKTARFISEVSNMRLPHSMPYVGKAAFAHKGGMHVDGVKKNTAAFEHINPEMVGNRRQIVPQSRCRCPESGQRLPAQLQSYLRPHNRYRRDSAPRSCRETSGPYPR